MTDPRGEESTLCQHKVITNFCVLCGQGPLNPRREGTTPEKVATDSMDPAEWDPPTKGEFEVIHNGLRESVVLLSTHRSALAELKAQLAAQPSVQRDELVSAINWACGCGDDDFVPTAGASGFLGTFWWRSELVKKSGLTWDRDKQRYILAERGNGER